VVNSKPIMHNRWGKKRGGEEKCQSPYGKMKKKKKEEEKREIPFSSSIWGMKYLKLIPQNRKKKKGKTVISFIFLPGHIIGGGGGGEKGGFVFYRKKRGQGEKPVSCPPYC